MRRICQLMTGISAILISPCLAHAQISCSGQTQPPPALYEATAPSDIGSGQAFTVLGRFCPAPPAGAGVQFTISDAKGKMLQQQTVTADGSGLASLNISAGLPTGSYTVFEQPVNTNNTVSYVYGGSSLLIGGGPDAALFNGQYNFLLQGTTGTSILHTAHLAIAMGTLTSDGQGNITSGVVDLNSPDVSLQNAAISGQYTYESGGVQTITLDTPIGQERFEIVTQADPANSHPPLTRAFLATPYGGNFVGTGTLLKRTLPLTHHLQGSTVFN